MVDFCYFVDIVPLAASNQRGELRIAGVPQIHGNENVLHPRKVIKGPEHQPYGKHLPNDSIFGFHSELSGPILCRFVDPIF